MQKSKQPNKPIRKRTRKPPIEDIRKAIESSNGILTQAARKLDVNPTTLYDWIKPEVPGAVILQKQIKISREGFIDEAETGLLKNIRLGKETSIIFALKTLGKQRGFEQNENAQVNLQGANIQINYLVPKELSEPQIKIDVPKNDN